MPSSSDTPWMDRVYGAVRDLGVSAGRATGERDPQLVGDMVHRRVQDAAEFIIGPQEIEGAWNRSRQGRGDWVDYATLGLTAIPFVPTPIKNAGKKGVRAGLKVVRKAVGKKKGGLAVQRGGPLVPGTLGEDIRYRVKNRDGSTSTVRTMSFGTDDGEVLVPTVIDGRVVSDDEAVDHYYRTGEHFGIFRTPQEATEYAQALHKRHAKLLGVK
jgi:hypothetical protein